MTAPCRACERLRPRRRQVSARPLRRRGPRTGWRCRTTGPTEPFPTPAPRRSPRRPTAVDAQVVSGDVTRGVGEEEHDGACDFLRPADASERDAGLQLADEARMGLSD